MTVRETTLRDWYRRFDGVENRCPWPGPRPLRKDDTDLLIGREQERSAFLDVIRSEARLVLLSGPSGVGKSSLLQAGLLPDLRDEGFVVLATDEWGSSAHTHPLRFLEESLLVSTRKVWGEAAIAGLVPDGTFLARLQEDFPGRGVLVLDQFEELIRYSPTMKREIFDLLVRINHGSEIKVVLSFRSEFLHEFEDLESLVNQYTLKYVPLRPIETAYAEQVVASGNMKEETKKKERKAIAITPAAVGWITRRWLREQARTDDVGITDPFGRVGLLHLQAMLYTLYFAAGQGVVDSRVIAALKEAGGLVDNEGRAVLTLPLVDKPDVDEENPDVLEDLKTDVGTYFPDAIVAAIGFKLQHCQEAGAGLDRYLLDGTSSMLTRAVEHLSSAGYKLIREIWDLADNTMGSNFDALEEGMTERHGPSTAAQRAALSATLTALADPSTTHDPKVGDVLTADIRTIATLADTREPNASASWSDRILADVTVLPPAYEADELEVTSGATAGLPPARVLIEELRRFHFAIIWLRASSLVRLTNPGAQAEVSAGAMVSLIHDGFGRPLREWAAKVGASKSGALFALTAPRDATFLWKSKVESDDQRPADVGGADTREVIANLRWRGGWVRADFKHVVFVNCDFQGTRFDRCRFEGVNFVNCILDGSIFSECRIHGAMAPLGEEVKWDLREPTFDIPVDAALVEAFAPYGRPGGGSSFYSGLPGTPAVPRHDEVAILAHASHPFVDGGMAVYGGRISGFGMRRCEVAPGSGVGMRHTTGSDLELVELVGHGRYDIFGCAIRHITFSSQPGVDEVPTIEVDAKHSLLTQLWLSGGVAGQIDILNCTLVQAWNGAEVDIKVKKSLLYGPIGPTGRDPRTVAADDEGTPLLEQTLDLDAAPELLRNEKLAQFGHQALRADYRQNPAQTAERQHEDLENFGESG